jgi:hypothetical protein
MSALPSINDALGTSPVVAQVMGYVAAHGQLHIELRDAIEGGPAVLVGIATIRLDFEARESRGDVSLEQHGDEWRLRIGELSAAARAFTLFRNGRAIAASLARGDELFPRGLLVYP